MSSILKEHQHKTKFGKFLHILGHIILYIWQLPQNLAGLGYKIIFLITKNMVVPSPSLLVAHILPP